MVEYRQHGNRINFYPMTMMIKSMFRFIKYKFKQLIVIIILVILTEYPIQLIYWIIDKNDDFAENMCNWKSERHNVFNIRTEEGSINSNRWCNWMFHNKRTKNEFFIGRLLLFPLKFYSKLVVQIKSWDALDGNRL